MHKLILFLGMVCVAPVLLRAQRTEPPRILDYKLQLPSLRGEEKAIILGQIARWYIDNGHIKSDSALAYSRQALEFAQENNLRYQIGVSACQYGRALLQVTKADEGLKYYRLAALIGREIRSDSLMALGYRGIGEALWYQSNFKYAIDTIRYSLPYFKSIGNYIEVSNATMVISNIHGDLGNYEEAFEGAREALRVGDSVHDKVNIILSLAQLGYLYKSVGDYETAMEYYRRAFSYNPSEGVWAYRHISNRLGDLYIDLKQFDSALFYIRQSFAGNPDSKTSRLTMGEYYLATKNYDSSLYYFQSLYRDLTKSGEGNIVMYATLGMAKVFMQQEKFKQADKYGLEALEQASRKGTKQVIHDACLYGDRKSVV